ncbi:hypothetical protein Z517_02598 [Fonsecaea pedrosoi CBS 271.37]|uniref:Unplaced genomic scaffold supercont1.2, whole genome shotgun sequence n=1 Tax=Fonsecaea pedrosoi CBS 271.37 TaxID=1442368 RepID=A0A0D2GQT9_9EURO|nr:uncharacterized protein Z517_02598 [Fonsecaea pedrosoi CBS 271.37]KIW83353.1 hypothetical protein Z517_02598 [Fonsecaea pedrosoi CBS 271.37]
MLLSTLSSLLLSAIPVLALPVDKFNDMIQGQSKRVSAAEYVGVAERAEMVEGAHFAAVDLAEVVQGTHNLESRLFAAEYLEGADGEEVFDAYPAYVDAADSAKILGEAQDLTKRVFAAEYIDDTHGEEIIEAYPAYVNAADSKKVMGE